MASTGPTKGTTSLPEALFGQQVHEHLLYLSVKRHLGNQRQGTAKVKSRGEVSGGGTQAVPPEGHRPRAPGREHLAADARRRPRLRSEAA